MFAHSKMVLRHTLTFALLVVYLLVSAVIVTAQQQPQHKKANAPNPQDPPTAQLIVNGKIVQRLPVKKEQNPIGKIIVLSQDKNAPTPAIRKPPATASNTINTATPEKTLPGNPKTPTRVASDTPNTPAELPPVKTLPQTQPSEASEEPMPKRVISTELIDRMTARDRVEQSIDRTSKVVTTNTSIKVYDLPLVDLNGESFPGTQVTDSVVRPETLTDRAVYYPMTENRFPIAQTSGTGVAPGTANPFGNAIPGSGNTNMLQPMTQPSIFEVQDPQQDDLPPGHIKNHFIQPQPIMNSRQRTLSKGEYLFDGGDRKLQVKVGDDWKVKGLDMEDTVGHFDTIDGERVVVPSNRVEIYAPRFASVGKVGNMTSANSFEKIGKVDDTRITFQSGTFDIAASSKQNVAPVRSLGSKSASALRDRTRGLIVDNTTQTGQTIAQFGPEKIHQFMVSGVLKDNEKAFLATAIQSAITWTKDLEVKVLNQDVHVLVVDDVDSMQEVHESHSPNTKSRLRIVKLADKHGAQPGDTIEFMIRFDNAGNQLIGNVTVIDNLTTRLEYIPGSASCSVKADLITADNEGQSKRLRWEILEPLKPGQGGVIKFKCRVR